MSSIIENTQVLFVQRPVGMLDPKETFKVVSKPAPTPGDDQVLVRTLYLSLDPAMRGWMNDARSYMPPIGIGEVMRGVGIGQVITSNSSKFKKGEFVSGMLGWQEYAVLSGEDLQPVIVPPGVSLPTAFALLGHTGLTAHCGLMEAGKPVAGDTVVVSGAAGATGSLVAQIAKIKGCRVVGIAGGEQKCRFLTEELGLDAAIDYRSPTFYQDLVAATPNYINVYFDNVGGDILDAVLTRMAKGARIALCGAISQYNTTQPRGPKNYLNMIAQSVTMQGFIVTDYAAHFKSAIEDLAKWQQQGHLKVPLHIVDGLSHAPEALLMLFNGKNRGKLMVCVATHDGAAKL